jgi:hypothetical protein
VKFKPIAVSARKKRHVRTCRPSGANGGSDGRHDTVGWLVVYTMLGPLPGAIVTLNGNPMVNPNGGISPDTMVLNLTSNTSFHGNVALTRGLAPDQVRCHVH